MITTSRCGLGSAGSNIGTSVGGTIMSTAPLIAAIPIAGLPAAAVVAAVGALVALGSVIAGALHIGEGCGATCVQATNVVNSAEPTFRMNLEAYETGVIDQPTAQNNFSQMWTAIQQSCGAIPGVAGQDCVSDRQSGACKWKQTGQPIYQGQPNLGECWNWWNAYHDPLTYDALVPYNAGSTNSSSSVVSDLTSNPLLIGGVLLAIGLMGD